MRTAIRAGVLALILVLCHGAWCWAGPKTAPPARFRIVVGGKVGYIDRQGREIIPARYTDGWEFSEGRAYVVVGGKSLTLIDPSGKAVASALPYSLAMDLSDENGGDGCFHDGMCMVSKDFVRGYADASGRLAIPFRYQAATRFSEGLAAVSTDKLTWAYIDRSGRTVIPGPFKGASPFRDGVALVFHDQKASLIRRDGTVVIESLPGQGWRDMNGDYVADIISGGEYAFIDRTGRVFLSVQAVNLGPFSQGLARVLRWQNDVDRWGFIDRHGKLVIPLKYDAVADFSQGLAAVNVGKSWGYVDTTGRVVIPMRFVDGDPFVNGLAKVRTGDAWGYIEPTGRFVWRTKLKP